MAILMSEDSGKPIKGRSVGKETDLSEIQECIREAFE